MDLSRVWICEPAVSMRERYPKTTEADWYITKQHGTLEQKASNQFRILVQTGSFLFKCYDNPYIFIKKAHKYMGVSINEWKLYSREN